MHRNTFLFIFILAVLAALVTGVNVGKKFQQTEVAPTPTPITTPNITPTEEPKIQVSTHSGIVSLVPTSSSDLTPYTHAPCGIALKYTASNVTLKTSTDSNLALINTSDSNDVVAITCQADIPRPAVSSDKIETRVISGVTTNLYHDQTAKDGLPMDALIFTHPTKKIDVAVLGYGPLFNSTIQTLTITQ